MMPQRWWAKVVRNRHVVASALAKRGRIDEIPIFHQSISHLRHDRLLSYLEAIAEDCDDSELYELLDEAHATRPSRDWHDEGPPHLRN